MLYRGEKEITNAYYGEKALSAIYYGVKLVWEAINSAIGAGHWNGGLPWNGNDAWMGSSNLNK